MHKLILLILCYSISGHAVDFNGPPGQLRLFIGTLSSSPKQVNTELNAQGIETFGSLSNFGIEGTYQVLPRVNLGVRGEGKWQKVKELASPPVNALNPYYSSIQQSAALLVLRVDVIRTPVFRFDIFGGAGTAATKMDLRSASGDSNYSRTMSSVISEAGASIGVGWSNIYFLVEGGTEWNKVNSLSKTGASSASVNEIDLSGSFVTIGILFNGLPKWIRAK